jgi:IMP dehydrogenase
MSYTYSPSDARKTTFVGVTFDDISLVPQYSQIESRRVVNLTTDFLGFKLKTPLLSSNMSTITESKMATAMAKAGAAGILHRYAKVENVCDWIRTLSFSNIHPIIPSIGIQTYDLDNALLYQESGADAVCIDVAHGDSQMMVEMIKHVKGIGMKVIAGNVCTYSGADRLFRAGADAIKVGIGNGSNCSTRVVTGHGIPQLTALMECSDARKNFPNRLIISDGGVKNSGDCVKALAFGADLVMSGHLFAGCPETPGEVLTGGGLVDSDGNAVQKWKKYSGMASTEARKVFDPSLSDDYLPEGIERLVLLNLPAEEIVAQLSAGIRSGLSYTGSNNLEEFRKNVLYVMVTNNGEQEGRPWGLTK